jgi:hypothetical protein
MRSQVRVALRVFKVGHRGECWQTLFGNLGRQMQLSAVDCKHGIHLRRRSFLLAADYCVSALPCCMSVSKLCLPPHPAALSSLSRWMLPSAPASPPALDPLSHLVNRQHHAKSRDIPYAALQGEEQLPQRSQVVYVGESATGTD